MEKSKDLLKKYEKNDLSYRLIADFKEECKDKEFNDFVNKIDLPIETLSKYTSILKESSIEYNNCKNCKCLESCKNKVHGHAYLPTIKEGTLSFSFKTCKLYKKYLEKKELEDNVNLYELPSEIKKANLKEIFLEDEKRYEVIKWIKEFIKDYKKDEHIKGLFLTGSFGSGKTYLLSALFNELSKKGIKSAIVFWPEYLNSLKSSFNGDKNEFKNKFEHLKKAPLLLIDDIGAENSTPWSRDDILSPILQYRMDEKLPTFFTSNLDMKALESHFATSRNSVETVKAKRIIERIKQLTEQKEIVSENLRK